MCFVVDFSIVKWMGVWKIGNIHIFPSSSFLSPFSHIQFIKQGSEICSMFDLLPFLFLFSFYALTLNYYYYHYYYFSDILQKMLNDFFVLFFFLFLNRCFFLSLLLLSCIRMCVCLLVVVDIHCEYVVIIYTQHNRLWPFVFMIESPVAGSKMFETTT